MIFSEEKIAQLRTAVSARLSDRRFNHTLRVESAAIKIAGYCLPDEVAELRVAALLHDIAKELDAGEQLRIMNTLGIEHDELSAPIYHSVTAPFIIKRDFPEFATEKVLSAAYNHTTAAPDMSLFDEIIFIADYIEDGRTYPLCVSAREALYRAFSEAMDREECIEQLHCATVTALDNTISEIVRAGKHLAVRTVLARNAFLGRRPMPLV